MPRALHLPFIGKLFHCFPPLGGGLGWDLEWASVRGFDIYAFHGVILRSLKRYHSDAEKDNSSR